MDIEAPALATISAYSWPGNIRQLENIVERLVVLNRSGTILATENKTHFNQSQAAILLGISRKQLRTRMKNLGLIGDHEDLLGSEKE